MAAEPRQTSIAKEDETRGSAPSLRLARPAFVLFEVCTRAAGPLWRRPGARTQQRPQGLEIKCTHACASGRGYGGTCWIRMLVCLRGRRWSIQVGASLSAVQLFTDQGLGTGVTAGLSESVMDR